MLAQFPKDWQIIPDTTNAELKEIFKKKPLKKIHSLEEFENETKLLDKFLNTIGYFDADYKHYVKDSLLITKLITKQRINSIVFYNPQINEINKIFPLKIKDSSSAILNFQSIDSFFKKIISHYESTGYPFVSSYFSDFKTEKDTVFCTLHIETGKPIKIDKILVEGYKNFPKKIIENGFKIRENMLFDKIKIEDISNKIKNFNFISEIKTPEILFTQDTTYLNLYIEKKNSNHFDGLIGFSNNDNNKIKFNGYLDFDVTNLLNKAEHIKMNWKSDGSNSQNFNTTIEIPFIFSTPIWVTYNLEMYKKDTLFLNIAHTINTNYEIQNNHRIGLTVKKVISNTSSSFFPSDVENFSKNWVGINYYLGINKKKGKTTHHFLLSNYFLTNPLAEKLSWMFGNTIKYEWQINNKNSLVTENGIGLLKTERKIENEMFRLGGMESLRGFAERSIVAKNYTFLKTDYVFRPYRSNAFQLSLDFSGYNYEGNNTILTFSPGIGFRQLLESSTFSISFFVGNDSENPISTKNAFLYLKYSQYF